MSLSDERGRVPKVKQLSHEKQVEMAKALHEQGHSNSRIAYIMRINESIVRMLLEPKIQANQTIWYPGGYHGRTDDEYTQLVADISLVDLIALVQKRAQEDGEWTINNDLVGDNEDKMRRMMVFVSAELNIQQCVGSILREKQEHQRTVDWVCRDLANASKYAVR